MVINTISNSKLTFAQLVWDQLTDSTKLADTVKCMIIYILIVILFTDRSKSIREVAHYFFTHANVGEPPVT